jgi:HSP20 family protein
VDRHPLNRGLDAVFRGLGSLIQIATDTARVQDDAATVFGVSLRVGRSAVKVAPAARVSRPAARRPPEPEEGRAPAADVFDEDDHFVVVVQLPGADEPSIRWSVHDDTTLMIRARSGDRRFARTIELDAAVNADTTTMRYENGVLELRLWKRC